MQRYGSGTVVLAASEAKFIRELADADLPAVVTPDELNACLVRTRKRWGDEPRVDQQIVLAMIADMANEARSLASH
jgi:hypothetical protein